MTENTPYQQLTRTFQRLSRFSHLAAIAGWDMFAMMPPGGSVARSEALAELGVQASLTGRNDLEAGGRKISGSAAQTGRR